MTTLESSESYKKSLSDAYPNQQMFPIDVISYLINKYGDTDTDTDTDTNTGEKSITESKLDSILSLVLGEGKDIFIACEINPEFENALISYYDTYTGKVYVKLK